MRHRVDIGFVGSGFASEAYGGYLHAWSFDDRNGLDWFKDFRSTLLRSAAKEYLPVYRMADGEYRFLMGRKFNFARRPIWREVAGVAAERLRLKNPDNWKTSWGENYPPERVRFLRKKLIQDIQYIANHGYLACYINDNGLNAFVEYNASIRSFLLSKEVSFTSDNYVPFHFVVGAICGEGFEEFYDGRRILVLSGLSSEKKAAIQESLGRLNARKVSFLDISSSRSMEDEIDSGRIDDLYDFCFVAAGIGSANILRQLMHSGTACLDIGGFINCLIDPNVAQHGGAFRFPSKIEMGS